MNPLVAALAKGKQTSEPGEDYGGDLHTRKATHISVPTESVEFHFSSGELNMPTQEGERYKLCFDVINSSSDSHDVRFKQFSRPYVEPYQSKENNENEPTTKPPLVRTATEQGA